MVEDLEAQLAKKGLSGFDPKLYALFALREEAGPGPRERENRTEVRLV
jgi:hypothetical protein